MQDLCRKAINKRCTFAVSVSASFTTTQIGTPTSVVFQGLASFSRFISGFFFRINEAQRVPNNGANHCLFPGPSLGFLPFSADSTSAQLDFGTNKYLHFSSCLHLLCLFCLCSHLYLNWCGEWQGSSGNLSLHTNGLALKCRQCYLN